MTDSHETDSKAITSTTPWWQSISSETRWAWLFLAPCFIGLLIFTYLPTMGSFWLSFNYWNLLSQPQWVGWENYQIILSDPIFWKTLTNTILFVIVTATLEVVLGLGLAFLLSRLKILQTLFRTVYFLPVITPMVSVALVWGWLYDSNNGLFNYILQTMHLIPEPIAWLYNEKTALIAVILLQVWKGVGYNMIFFLAALQGVPKHLEESGELDGATPTQRFFHIILPLLTPTLFFVTTISIINAFQVFDSIYLLTEGGPNHATELMVYWMFKNAFQFYQVGPASAIAYILFVIILALTLTQWQLRKKWVLYEDETA